MCTLCSFASRYARVSKSSKSNTPLLNTQQFSSIVMTQSVPELMQIPSTNRLSNSSSNHSI